jgi:mannan endo-1,4-beta-mannosidase
MRTRVALVAVTALVATVLGVHRAEAFPATGRDRLISYLSGISGRSTVSGQHNREPNADPTKYTRTAQAITGQTPGLWGGDFLFLPEDVNARQTMVSEAIRQWQGGSLVALTWHLCPPTTGPTCNWDAAGVLSHLTDTQWAQLITDGSALNTAFKRRIDEVVPYLRQLQTAGVPVLWRPIHEMNDGWSWWGGRGGANGSRRLYQIEHDYLAAQGLTNLVWVWNVKDVTMGSIADYWPGASYVDVASLDVWAKLEPSAADYQAMLALAGGKPIALAEVGRVPSPALMDAQPRWAWWMVWAEWLTDPAYNTDAGVQAGYFSPRVLNRGEIQIAGPPAGKLRGVASGRCVDVQAANPANGTAVQLYDCDNGGSAQAWTVGPDGTVRALGKCLDVMGGGSQVQIWDCTAGNPNQRWIYDGATQVLTNPASGRCLDAVAEGTVNGTRLQVWSCNGKANQRWALP